MKHRLSTAPLARMNASGESTSGARQRFERGTVTPVGAESLRQLSNPPAEFDRLVSVRFTVGKPTR